MIWGQILYKDNILPIPIVDIRQSHDHFNNKMGFFYTGNRTSLYWIRAQTLTCKEKYDDYKCHGMKHVLGLSFNNTVAVLIVWNPMV